MESLWEIIAVFLLSTVKFVFGAVPMALSMGFPFFEAVTITSLGGFTGVTFFVLMSDKLMMYLKKRNAFRHHQNQSAKKIFTRRNKTIVKVKHRYGLPGIALLTPLLLSIPIGCFIAVRYFKNKHQILIYMFCSILFWSVFISSFKFLFR
jgi:uncharacterized membrane protein